MKLIGGILIGLLVLAIIVGMSLMGSYNSLVTGREAVDTQWAQVESQYQRRFDLIPNLVESVKGVMEQEKEIFTALAEARTRYSGAQTPEQKVEAANQVESALGRLLVITENYPQLKSSEVMQTFMAQLEGTENRISVERQRYNEQVQSYNLQVKRFPGSIIASMFGFSPRTMFEAAAGAENAPKVEF